MSNEVKEFVRQHKDLDAKVVQKNLAEPAKIEAGKGLMFLMDGGTGGMQKCECGKVGASVCMPVK